ncbi:hypothetical protein [Deinococcus yunweiensis]|uniref:hypothetical protein n=1 Tax=Deinococcus yunweiensis TaxID=367282 RepID=UPI00398EED69
MTSVMNDNMLARLNHILHEMEDIVNLNSLAIHGIDLAESSLEIVEMKARGNYLYQSSRPLLGFLNIKDDFLAQEAIQDEIKAAKAMSEFASRQKLEGNTKLVETFTIYLWSRMDTLIFDVLLEYMTLDETLVNSPLFTKIKLPLSFMFLEEEEKKEHLLRLIEGTLDIPLKQGIGKFEAMLGVFGLGGAIPKKLSDKIFELSNIRNIIAHRNSQVDAKFVSNCPHLGYTIGQKLRLTEQDFTDYCLAIFAYVTYLKARFWGREPPHSKFPEFQP